MRAHAIGRLAFGACALLLPVRVGLAAAPASSEKAAPPKDSAAAAPAAAGGATAGAAQPDASQPNVSLFPIKGDKPLSVRSDELEAIEDEGRRHLLFTRNVHVEQGDLIVDSDKLEAFYPPGGSQPDRLVATGRVRVTQLQRTMLCETATFFQTENRVLCVGNAQILQDGDRAQGREIEIFLKQNRAIVRGGAVVNMTPKTDQQTGAKPDAKSAAKTADPKAAGKGADPKAQSEASTGSAEKERP